MSNPDIPSPAPCPAPVTRPVEHEFKRPDDTEGGTCD